MVIFILEIGSLIANMAKVNKAGEALRLGQETNTKEKWRKDLGMGKEFINMQTVMYTMDNGLKERDMGRVN